MLRIIFVLIILGIANKSIFAQQLPSPNSKYVSLNGKNTDPGTRLKPWATIQHAIDQAEAGTTVVILPGIYHERVSIKNKSGKPNRWITIKAERYGTVTVTGKARYSKNEDFLGVFELDNANYIKISGLEITHDGNHYTTPNTIRLAGIEINPSAHHIRIENNDIHSVNTRMGSTKEYAYPIIALSMKDDATNINNLEIIGNKIHDSETNTGDGIIYCEMIHLLGNIHDVLVKDNEVYNSESSGISVSGNYRDSSVCKLLSLANDRVRNVVINNNIFRNMRDFGVYVNGCNNVLVERNYIEDCGYGIGVLTETGKIDKGNDCGDGLPSERVWIRNNIVIDSKNSDLVLGMYRTHATRNYYEPIRDVYVTNNTFWGAKAGPSSSAIMLLPGILGECRFLNNIIVSNGFLLTRADTAGFDNTVKLDYNLWYSTAPAPFRYGSNNNLPPRNFEDYSTDYKQDINSLFVSHQFSMIPLRRSSFKLSLGSPAINRGNDKRRPGWYKGFGNYDNGREQDHFNGLRKRGRIDIGADEY